MVDFSMAVDEFLEESHNVQDLKASCFADGTFIGLHVPHNNDTSKARYLILTDEGRVIDGYNLSGYALQPE